MKHLTHLVPFLIASWSATVVAEPAPAPDVWWHLDGTLVGDSSSNMKPAIRDVMRDYNDEGPCSADNGWATCDSLRFGFGMGAGPMCDDSDPLTVFYDPGEDVGISLIEPRLDTIPGEDNGQQSSWTYCGDNDLDLHIHDAQSTAMWEATFPDTIAATDAQLDAYWERPNLQIFATKDIAQTADGLPDDRVINTMRQLCVMHAGPNGLPSMPTWVFVERFDAGPAVLYGGLLSAAGGTGTCEIQENGAWVPLDVCAHVNDPAVTEASVRAGLVDGTYRCGEGPDSYQTGALDYSVGPGTQMGYQILVCHLTGRGDDNCNKRETTDLLGILTCVRQLPRGVSAADAIIQYCTDPADVSTCTLLTEENGEVEFIDERKTLFVLPKQENCDAGGVIIETCIDGAECDTGLPGRCGQGVTVCVDGVETCEPLGPAYPEICNGLDDDCDGAVDNMTDSWPKPQFTSFSLPTEHAGLDCNMVDVCVCPGGVVDSHDYSSFDSYLDSWSGECACGEGLAPTGPSDGPLVDDPREEQAACSFAGQAWPASLLVLLIGLIGGRARRQRG